MKSNKTKSVMTALVVAAMVCTAAMPIKAAEAKWVNDNGTWSYVKEDGSKAKGWIKDDGCWYAFDDNGSMRTGWVASHEHWYFMGESGVMQSNAWVEDNGARYFIKGTGVMAKDYVKDGYELTSDGKAIPLAETNSVVVTDPSAVEGQVIEGNLYVDVTTAKELELKGVTVKGKLVIIGDNQTAGKVTVTDSKIEAISTQTRNAEVVLSGETAVKEIVIEETSAVTPDKNFKGEVEKIEVQSTTKGEIKIEVPAQEVSTRTYASVDIQAPVEHLEVKTDTQVKVNADVKNVVVTESAKDTKVEVSKGNTVGTIVADAPVKIEGSGTIEKVEANVDGVQAGEDTVIKEVEKNENVTTAPEVSKPEKPSTGGGSTGGSGGGSYVPPTIKDGVESKEELVAALKELTDGGTIYISKNFSVDEQLNITNDMIPTGVSNFTIDGQNMTISRGMSDPTVWDDNNAFVISFYNFGDVEINLKDIKLTGSNAGLNVNGSHVILDGKIDVTGNGFGGIEVAPGKNVDKNSKVTIKSSATLIQNDEARSRPFLWTDKNNNTGAEADALVEDKTNGLTQKDITNAQGKSQTYYYLKADSQFTVNSAFDLVEAVKEVADNGVIKIGDNFKTDKQINIEKVNLKNDVKSFTIDGQNMTISRGMSDPTVWDDNNAFVISFYNFGDIVINLKNIKLTGSNAGLNVNGSHVILDGKIDVTGNGFGGIEVAPGKNVTKNSKVTIKSSATSIQNDEARSRPFLWTDKNNNTGAEADALVEDKTNGLTQKDITNAQGKSQTYYYLNKDLASNDTSESDQEQKPTDDTTGNNQEQLPTEEEVASNETSPELLD